MAYRARIRAASGWLEIGLPEEALAELAPLPWRLRIRKPVLRLRLMAEMASASWNAASETARLLCIRFPTDAEHFLHAAYCLHETGDTTEACRWLLRGPKSLFAQATFHYNLACYLNVLGQHTRARSHLRDAFRLDASLREHAARDGDLAGLVVDDRAGR